MRRVQVESPFAPQTPEPPSDCSCPHEPWPGGHWPPDCDNCQARDRRKAEKVRNQVYLAACLADCIRRGETPYASHGLLTLPGVLDDTKPEDRAKGIAAGFAMRERMDATVFYTDLGWSNGMRAGQDHARELAHMAATFYSSHDVVYRELGPDWDKEVA